MTTPEPTPLGEQDPEPLGEEESGFTDEELDALDDDAPVENMAHVRKLRNQAQRLRHRLRESEANRQAVEDARAGDLARLAAYEKDAIERAAGTVLVDPADLWAFTDEATQASFNDEFGQITTNHVIEAAKALAANKPHLAKPNADRPPTQQPVEGLRPGASPESKPKPTSWQTAIRG